MKAKVILPALLAFCVFSTSYSASAQTNRDDKYSNRDTREYSEEPDGDYSENDDPGNETYSEPDSYGQDDGYTENDGYGQNDDQGDDQYGYEQQDNTNNQDYNNDTRQYGNDSRQYNDDSKQYNDDNGYAARPRPNINCRRNGYSRGSSGYFQFPGGSVAINSGRHGYVRARVWIAGQWAYSPRGHRYWVSGHYAYNRANW